MKKKILYILGCTGMLGSDLLKIFSKKNEFLIYASYREKKLLKILKKKELNCSYFKLDISNKNDISNFKKNLKKNSLIINCIGLIKPYINEGLLANTQNAIQINTIFPHTLNNFSKKKNCKVYQIATDCVFSGKVGDYLERDFHDAEDVYGKTKSLGEIKDKNFYNIRTSIIGEENYNKKSLVEWFKSSAVNSELNGFRNHKWNGLTTKVFSELLYSIIKCKIDKNLIHLIPKNQINKYQLLKILQKKFKRRDIIINSIFVKNKINRTLSTDYKNMIDKIWKHSIYKKKLSIENMILKYL